MTLEQLEQIKPPTISIKVAAKIMNVNPGFLQLSLQDGKFPFGIAEKKKRWVYYINTERFIKYMKGQL